VTRVVVVGGGITGLAAAHALVESGAAGVTLVEAADRVGGAIRTEEIDGFRVEWAASGFLDSGAGTLRLIERIGLAQRLAPANPAAARRYIFRGGRLHLVPMSPIGFLRSPILSIRGRLRVLGEPFAPRGAGGVDESVHAFAARRIGEEAARVLVGAMVSGVFAGDARRLSLASAFPVMRAMEARHGSLVRALIAKRLAARRAGAVGGRAVGGPSGPAGRLTSFAGGMEEMPRRLAERLGERARVRAPVEALDAPAGEPGWRVRLAPGETLAADAVLLACPPSEAARLVAPRDAPLAELLAGIARAPLAVIALGYRLSDLATLPDGFGFLVPRGEELRPLGALFDSNIYAGRAPAGRALVRVLIGGACDPDAVDLDDGRLVTLARDTLRRACAIDAEPCLVRVVRHRAGIPQYVTGHAERLRRIEGRLAAHPGLYVAGNGYTGVAVSACVADGERVAGTILRGSRAAFFDSEPDF